jgi:hypothetical protein
MGDEAGAEFPGDTGAVAGVSLAVFSDFGKALV